MWENLYIYTTKWDEISWLRDPSLKLNDMIQSYNIPLPEIMIQSDLTMMIYLGCIWWCIMIIRSVDSPCWEFSDFLDQASWCHVGQARSSWLPRCSMGCHRLWCWGILLNSWHGRNSWSLFHLGCQCCRCSRCGLHAWCRWGNAGCPAKKQCLGRPCSVAVVPLGTVSTALTLCTQRCLHVWWYVEPLLVHTW